MRFKIRHILAGPLFLALLISSAWGETYHVSMNGNDGNSGTSWGSAWRSIARVNSDVSSGDTVWFGTGIWRGTMIDPVSGNSASQPTVYACSAFVEGIANIWASDSVSGWTNYSGNIWRASYDPGSGPSWFSGTIAIVGQLGNGYDTALAYGTSIPNREGYFYYDNANDYMYVWLVGGGNPNNFDIEPGKTTCVGFYGEDHVKIWGFNFRYGRGLVAFRGIGSWDSSDSNFVEHCTFRGVGTNLSQNNVALVYSNATAPPNIPGEVTGWGNTIRACTLNGLVFDPDMDASIHRYALGFYSQWGAVVESCLVIDNGNYHKGIKFKSDCWYGTIRYNTIIMRGGQAAIQLTANYVDIDIYGNLIINEGYCSDAFHFRGASDGNPSNTANVSVRNNTVVSPRSAFMTFPTWDEEEHGGNNFIQYNLFYLVDNRSGGIINILKGDTAVWTIDENMYYVTQGDSVFNTEPPGYVTLANWRSHYGFDINSVFGVDPEFSDPGNNDYTRPDVDPEINVSYAGRTWTLYGAWQPGDYYCPPADPPDPVSPANGAVDLTEPILFAWDPVSSANYYQLQVDDNQAFTSPEINEQVSGTSYNATGFNGSTTYYWRMRTNDSCGWGGWSANPWSFTTECGTLASPELRTPVDGATGLVQPFSLTWWPEAGIDYYEVQVDTNSSFANPLIDAQATVNVTLVYGLPVDIPCYWKVRSVHDVCGTSPWSETWSFTAMVDTTTLLNLAAGIMPDVDGTYGGYNPVAVTDENHSTTWASTESSQSAHWIDIDFNGEALVERVDIYWAWNQYASSWMTSQEFQIQAWDPGINDFYDVEVVNLSNTDSMTMVDIDPQIVTSRM